MAGFWFERLGEPLCSTREEAERFLSAELERSVPEGWTVSSRHSPGSSWVISRNAIPEGEWENQEYGIRLSQGRDLVIFTYGNNDVGPLDLQHLLLQALVIDAAALVEFGVPACIEYLFANCRANEWGYT